MSSRSAPGTRRQVLSLAALLVSAVSRRPLAGESAPHPDAKWYREALAMKLLAQSWGDQSYGAVVVLDNTLVGAGPSRVVKDGNPDAHAERVALLDAQRRLGRLTLSGARLYSPRGHARCVKQPQQEPASLACISVQRLKTQARPRARTKLRLNQAQ
jgi:hypothetical protein